MKISERIPHTEHTLRLQAGKKVYFVSDVHLGAPVLDNDRERENRLIRWLDTIRPIKYRSSQQVRFVHVSPMHR